MCRLNAIIATCFAMAGPAVCCGQPPVPDFPVPKIDTGEWHWIDPHGKKHPMSIKDLGRKGVFVFTDHADQTGIAVFNEKTNRFDILDGRLKGEAFYIPERKKFVLVTVTGSVALYHQGAP